MFLKQILLWTLLFSCTFSIAQAPGYMGRRVSAGYGFYFNPAFSNIVIGYGDSPVNTLHELFMEYATGKKFALGFSAKIYRFTHYNMETVDVNGIVVNGDLRQIDQNPSGSYLIKGTNYQVYGKFFKDKYLAPWGRYFLLGLTINRYTTEYDPEQMKVLVEKMVFSYAHQRYEYQRMYFNDFGPTTQTYLQADVFFGNGNSRILSNRIVLDYGYTINVLAMARLFLMVDDDFEVDDADVYVRNTSINRVAAINRFNFFLKLGYLF